MSYRPVVLVLNGTMTQDLYVIPVLVHVISARQQYCARHEAQGITKVERAAFLAQIPTARNVIMRLAVVSATQVGH